MSRTDYLALYEYTIDNQDQIAKVSTNWDSFETAAQDSGRFLSAGIIGLPVWDFIDGAETSLLYKVIFNRIRKHNSSIVIPYRCDSPTVRRTLELHLSARLNGSIDFYSYLLQEECRDTVDLFDPSFDRSNEHIRVCSICKRVALSDHHWVEVEAAIAHLGLFTTVKMPQITHGLCPECYAMAMAELDSSSPPPRVTTR
ncbi:hypothetical protein GMST_04880 [Geomonas silvestris]|uniref:Uncharacterized protein n=1 Tax=Geomonas silvestris TaxID=2740184 RepID=A0A6V8MEB2_9BACT|nr:hypothetical protein [Geomonas silvestris]GFO58163.1 hypothetical protein GMST_04880 [Geomonas silvestris]